MPRERKPKTVDRYELSISIPLYSKSKMDRSIEISEKLGHIEEAVAEVNGTCEIASHVTNERRQ